MVDGLQAPRDLPVEPRLVVVQAEYRHRDAVLQQGLCEVTQVLVKGPLIVEVRAIHEIGPVEHAQGQLAQVGDRHKSDPREESPRAARDDLPGLPHGRQLLDREVAEEAEEERHYEQLAEGHHALEDEERQQVGLREV